MDISMMFTVAALVFMLLYAGIGVLKTLRKNWIMSLIRLGVTLLAAVLAIPLCKLLLQALSDTLYEMVVPVLPELVVDLLSHVAVGLEGMRVMLLLIITPLLYPILYLILHRVLMIVVWIVEKFVAPLLGEKRRGISMGIGAFTGLVSAIILLIPICGYVMLGAHIIETATAPTAAGSAMIEDEMLGNMDLSAEDLDVVTDDLEKNPVVTVVHYTLGKPIFKALTTSKLNPAVTHGVKVTMHLESEICGFITTAGYVRDSVAAMGKEDFTTDDKKLLLDTVDSLMVSEWIRLMTMDLLTTMSEKWLAGETFMLMDRPTLDASLDPVIISMLTILSTETLDTLRADLYTLLDVMGDLLMHDLLNGEDYTALVQKLGTDGLINEMMTKLEANPRMEPLTVELKALSLRLVSNMLGVEQLKDGRYAEMMDDVAETLTDTLSMSKEDRDALIVGSLQDTFAAEGYDIPADVITEMSDQMIADLGSDGEITGGELTDYLVNYSGNLPAGAVIG